MKPSALPLVILAAAVALGGAITHLPRRSVNPTTGEVQHLALTPEQEISLGLQESPGVTAQAQDPVLAVRLASAWPLGAALAGAAPLSSTGIVWDLTAVYPNEASWAADRERVLRGLTSIGRLAGRAGRSAGELADVLDAVHDLRARAGKMARFAVLSHELDSSSQESRARYDTATALEARVEEAVGFLRRDVTALDPALLARWQAAEPRLFPHRLRLHEILTHAAHSASPQVEAVLANMVRWPHTTSDVADELLGGDLGWKSIQVASVSTAVDSERFDALRRSADGALRSAASTAYMSRLRAFEPVFGLLASRRIEADLAIGRARGFDDFIDADLARNDDLPPGLAPRVIASSRAHAELAVRFARVLRRITKVDALGYSDLRYLPVPYQRQITVPEATEIVVGAVAPLGPAYQARLRTRLAQPWMHLAPTPHKTGNVGVYWAVGGGHPYTMMTYRDDLASSRVFASGAMLMMDYADLPPGFVPDLREEDQPVHGNVIWTAARLLHDDYLLARTTDPRERVALLVDSVRYLWRAFQVYAVATELERAIAASIQAGRPMTGAEISKTNLSLLRAHLGDGKGGAKVEETAALEWITQNNLFSGHAHPVFMLCAVGAAALVEKVAAGDNRAIAGLRDGLSKAESLYSHDLLKAMGIDLAEAPTREAIFRRMSNKLDALEREATALDGRG